MCTDKSQHTENLLLHSCDLSGAGSCQNRSAGIRTRKHSRKVVQPASDLKFHSMGIAADRSPVPRTASETKFQFRHVSMGSSCGECVGLFVFGRGATMSLLSCLPQRGVSPALPPPSKGIFPSSVPRQSRPRYSFDPTLSSLTPIPASTPEPNPLSVALCPRNRGVE